MLLFFLLLLVARHTQCVCKCATHTMLLLVSVTISVKLGFTATTTTKKVTFIHIFLNSCFNNCHNPHLFLFFQQQLSSHKHTLSCCHSLRSHKHRLSSSLRTKKSKNNRNQKDKDPRKDVRKESEIKAVYSHQTWLEIPLVTWNQFLRKISKL